MSFIRSLADPARVEVFRGRYRANMTALTPLVFQAPSALQTAALGAAAQQRGKRQATRSPGRSSRPSGTRPAGGADGRKGRPAPWQRPRCLGYSGA